MNLMENSIEEVLWVNMRSIKKPIVHEILKAARDVRIERCVVCKSTDSCLLQCLVVVYSVGGVLTMRVIRWWHVGPKISRVRRTKSWKSFSSVEKTLANWPCQVEWSMPGKYDLRSRLFNCWLLYLENTSLLQSKENSWRKRWTRTKRVLNMLMNYLNTRNRWERNRSVWLLSFCVLLHRSSKVILMTREIQVSIEKHQGRALAHSVLDNSWMESEAVNMHDETGELTKELKLEAGNYRSIAFIVSRRSFWINSSCTWEEK